MDNGLIHGSPFETVADVITLELWHLYRIWDVRPNFPLVQTVARRRRYQLSTYNKTCISRDSSLTYFETRDGRETTPLPFAMDTLTSQKRASSSYCMGGENSIPPSAPKRNQCTRYCKQYLARSQLISDIINLAISYFINPAIRGQR